MFEFGNLDSTPSESKYKSHYYCDYVELVSLCEPDDIVSVSDIYDRFYEDGKVSHGVSSLGDSNSDDGDACEPDERWVIRITEWFDILAVRMSVYGESYPFEVSGTSIRLKDNLSSQARLYLALLISSSLKYVDSNRNLFTSAFEEISSLTLRSYLPPSGRAYVFGKSSASDSRYEGSLKEKMSALAKDLGVKVVANDEDFQYYDTGDGGVDIVAWVPFDQDVNKDCIQLLFAQCAAGKNWDSKQNSVVKLKNYLNLPDGAQNVLFVPYDLRGANRQYTERTEITASVVFDRYRILSLLDANTLWAKSTGEQLDSAVQSAIEYELDIV
ncbi:MAG: hypothetical protein OIF57_18395 [Marinobacterium sp.]|nr:hypothetical protein [Marinobacterium sp.]